METLPDDLAVEILVRVDGAAALFRCAVTCTRWRRLIADASFLSRSWPEGVPHPSYLLGFFVKPLAQRGPGIIPYPAPSFVVVPWSPLRDGYGFQGHHGLTARRGLLLNHNLTERDFNLSVFDPLARKARVLPPLKYNGDSTMQGYTILTDLDYSTSSKRRWPIDDSAASFKVLIITVHRGQPGYSLHVFTSAKGTWSRPRKFFQTWEHRLYVTPLQANAAVCQGTARWLFRTASKFYTLNVCANNTAHMSITSLPITTNPYHLHAELYSEPLLSVTNGGTLSFLRLYTKGAMLEIWTRQGQGDNKIGEDGTVDDCWYRTQMIKLQRPNKSKIDLVQCVCVGEMSGKLVFNNANQEGVYMVDLQTGALETITELFRGSVERTIPFEMDWPAFFMSRLAGSKRTKPGEEAIKKIADSFWGLIAPVSVIFGPIALSWAR